MKRGFTLLEVLLVIALVGILSAVGFTSLSGARQRAQLVEAQTLVTVELERSRASARRTERDALVQWTPRSINGKALKEGFTISTAPGSFSYTAPHGRTTLGEGLELELSDARGRTAKVAVIGVTGKIIRRPLE